MNIKSRNGLIDYIQYEKSWRNKELLNFKSRAISARGVDQLSLFKLGVCLVYSHWEGFVKNSSSAFFKHLIKNGYKYTELQNHYRVCAILEHFDGQYPHKNFNSNLILVKNEIDFAKSIKVDADRFIDTKSNLNSEVLREILNKIGLSFSIFELRSKFIDESLVTLRNSIAHGEYRTLQYAEFLHIYEETMNLINIFSNEIENFIIQKKFLN